MRRWDTARALAAVVVLMAVVVAVPAALVTMVGWPLPRTAPDLSGIGDTLSGDLPLQVTTVWRVLAIGAWLAWAQIVVAVMVEASAAAKGGLPRQIRGLGFGQSLAAPLVAAIVLAWPSGAMARMANGPASLPLASAVTASTVEAEPSVTPWAAPPPEAEVPAATTTFVEHVVVRRDTLWDLAERYLGNGERAVELFHLNAGRLQPDGRRLTEPGLLRPGWIIRIPIDATTISPVAPERVTVEPGDTLSGIAEEALGDPGRYPEIMEINRGRPQPDGGSLTNPHLIRSGWEFVMPTDQAVAPPEQPSEIPPPPIAPVPNPPEPEQSEAPAPPVADTPDRPSEAPPAAGPSSTSSPDSTPEPSQEREVDAEPALPIMPVGLIGGGLATAGLLVLLDRRRRAQQRHRRAGERLPVPPAALQEVERELRTGADTESATFVEAALRAAMAGSGPAGPPPFRWVESDAHGVTMVLATESEAPTGFAAVGECRWHTTATLDELAQLGQSSASPTPALVPIGRADTGAEVLVDLETRVTTVVGEPLAVQGLLRAVAVAAATSPWSDQARVILVGHDGAALPSTDGLESCGDVDRVLDELQARREAVAHNLGFLGYETVTEARASGVTPDAWEPLLVVFAERPPDEHVDRLREILRDPSPGIAVVVHGAPGMEQFGRGMSITDDELTIDGLDIRLRPRALDADSLRQVTQLLDQASAPSVPADEPARAPRDTLVEAGPTDGTTPRALDELLQGVEVIVHVLGEVHATAPPGDDLLTIPKQKSLEALTYLALRESPVDREELQAALWPSGTNTLKTFHNTIWAARKALSTARPDSDLFPDPAEGRYTLSEGMVTDYGLFSELVALADEREDAREAAMLLAEALTLVHGEPFTGGGRGYAWVAPHTGLIIAQVVDAAEELAEVRLAGDDWRGAEWAARQGLKVCPYEERLYRLLMRSAFAAGSLPGVRRVYDELTSLLADPDDGVEPEDTVHPDTVALLDRLTRAYT